MQKDKQQPSEENTYLRIVQERVNLNEYAGDAEDDSLARDQANEYIDDCERRLNAQVSNVGDRRGQ